MTDRGTDTTRHVHGDLRRLAEEARAAERLYTAEVLGAMTEEELRAAGHCQLCLELRKRCVCRMRGRWYG